MRNLYRRFSSFDPHGDSNRSPVHTVEVLVKNVVVQDSKVALRYTGVN
jgi:hypothetical protein